MSSNICIEEHCVSITRDPTADIIAIMKTETSYSLPLVCLPCTHSFLSFPDSISIPHWPCSILAPPSSMSVPPSCLVPGAAIPPRHPYHQLYCCLPSIWSKGTAVERICMPANIAAWMRNGMGKGKNKHPAPSAPLSQPKKWVGGQLRPYGPKSEESL